MLIKVGVGVHARTHTHTHTCRNKGRALVYDDINVHIAPSVQLVNCNKWRDSKSLVMQRAFKDVS